MKLTEGKLQNFNTEKPWHCARHTEVYILYYETGLKNGTVVSSELSARQWRTFFFLSVCATPAVVANSKFR